MPPGTPLHIVLPQVLLHTPVWVWGVLALITVLGLRQTRDHVVTSRRLTAIPLIWASLSLWGALHAVGTDARVVAAWAAALAASVALTHSLAAPRRVDALGAGRYAVQGSMSPLLAMWAVFVVRYVSSVMLVLNPSLRHDTLFGLAVPALYGALSGVFAARAWRTLRAGAISHRVQPA